MKISTKGHYAVQALVDIASQPAKNPVSLNVIASRQELSQQYLEQLFVKLRRANLVHSIRGPGGGYLLAKSSSMISIGEIFVAVGENLTLTECIDGDGSADLSSCDKACDCKTRALWSRLHQHFNELLCSITIADVVNGDYIFAKETESGAKNAG